RRDEAGVALQPHAIEIAIQNESATEHDVVCAKIGAVFGRHAGRIAQRLFHAVGLLRLDLIPRYDGYRLRDFNDRRIRLGRGIAAVRDVALYGSKRRIAFYVYRIELHGLRVGAESALSIDCHRPRATEAVCQAGSL